MHFARIVVVVEGKFCSKWLAEIGGNKLKLSCMSGSRIRRPEDEFRDNMRIIYLSNLPMSNVFLMAGPFAKLFPRYARIKSGCKVQSVQFSQF